jgi:hypothetical protein
MRETAKATCGRDKFYGPKRFTKFAARHSNAAIFSKIRPHQICLGMAVLCGSRSEQLRIATRAQ